MLSVDLAHFTIDVFLLFFGQLHGVSLDEMAIMERWLTQKNSTNTR